MKDFFLKGIGNLLKFVMLVSGMLFFSATMLIFKAIATQQQYRLKDACMILGISVVGCIIGMLDESWDY